MDKKFFFKINYFVFNKQKKVKESQVWNDMEVSKMMTF